MVVRKNLLVNEEDWEAFKRYASRYKNMTDAFHNLSEIRNERSVRGMVLEKEKKLP